MVKITVEPLIYMSPKSVILNLEAGKRVSQFVTIRAGTDKPLHLTPGEFSLNGKVTYEIQEVEKGREWDIEFTALGETVENFHGFLKLKTSYPERPDIAIIITGRDKAPIDPRLGVRPHSPEKPLAPPRRGP